MVVPEFNWIAIVAAVVAAMALGFFWFSPVGFMKQWMRGIEKTPEQVHRKSPVLPLSIMVVMTLISVIGIATLWDWMGRDGIVGGLIAGAFLWVFAILPVKLNDVNFEGRPFILFPVSAGFYLLNYLLMGAVIGAIGV